MLMSAFGLASSLPVFAVLFALGKLALQACQVAASGAPTAEGFVTLAWEP